MRTIVGAISLIIVIAVGIFVVPNNAEPVVEGAPLFESKKDKEGISVLPDTQYYKNGVNVTDLGYANFNEIIAIAEQKGKAAGRKIDPDAGYLNDLDLRYYEVMYEPYDDSNMTYLTHEVRHRISWCWYSYDINVGIKSLTPITAYDESDRYLPYCGE